MAREATISQEDVNAAADSIRAAGRKPTARAVREQLGRGSMATVLKFLQTWQSGQVQAPATPLMLPTALQRPIVDFIAQEVATAKWSLEQDLAQAQQTQQDLIKENEEQASALVDLQRALEDLQVEYSRLSGQNAQLNTDFEDTRQSVELHRQAAEAARTEIAKLQFRLEGVPRLEAEFAKVEAALKADLAKVEAALEAERAARVAADQTAAVATARIEQSQHSVEDLKIRLARAETEAREANHEAGRLRGQVGTLQGALDTTSKELSQTKSEARQAEALAAEFKGQLAALMNGASQNPEKIVR